MLAIDNISCEVDKQGSGIESPDVGSGSQALPCYNNRHKLTYDIGQ